MLHINPDMRPTVHDLLETDLWINDPANGQSLEEYVMAMERIYLINHGM